MIGVLIMNPDQLRYMIDGNAMASQIMIVVFLFTLIKFFVENKPEE